MGGLWKRRTGFSVDSVELHRHRHGAVAIGQATMTSRHRCTKDWQSMASPRKIREVMKVGVMCHKGARACGAAYTDPICVQLFNR